MTQINAKIDDRLLQEFRGVIYTRKGLRKGDFKESLEEAMLNYVLKYSKSAKTKDLATYLKTKD